MRLDIVTNDAGELVRREHARELGASVVVAIYRLVKLAQMHDLANQAFVRQLEQTHQMIGEYCLRSGANVNILFAHKAIFVAGQLLKGSRSTYEMASELGDVLERLGGSELSIQRDLTREELLAFGEQISAAFRTGASFQFRSPTPKIRLRAVADAARLRGLELEHLASEQRIVRTYASAVVIMRRFFEDLAASKYVLPRRIKRIAQSLVDLSEGSTPAFLGVTEVRNANFDEAGRAVNTAILAVTMAREITQDRAVLAQIAMAAMMHDVARPRALALAAAGGPALPGMAGPTTLSEDQEDRLPAGSAAVLTALGRVNEPSITRTVLAFEALWLRRRTWLGPVYWGMRAPTLHAKLIAIARRYNDLLTPEPGLAPKTPDFAVAQLSEELKEPHDRVVLRLLVSALGLLPAGTVVQLTTGETAEVVRGPTGPGEKPRVRMLGGAAPIEVDLADDPRREVARVLSVDGWRKGLEAPATSEIPSGYDPDAAASAAPAPPPAISPLAPLAMPPPTSHRPPSVRPAAPPEGSVDVASASASISVRSGEQSSSASLPSMGSTPSAVAEAMGRMIAESVAPPAPLPDRTVVQPQEELPPARVSARPAAGEPTARGDLASTPLPHVLVYMLDHSLTGSVVFEGEGGGDVVVFRFGVPVKIRLRERVALLGEILARAGALDTSAIGAAVAGAERLAILLGEYLVGHELVTREALSWALEAQLLEKIAHLANLAPDTSYAYYRDVDMLERWGGGDVAVSAPLNPILASVRNWMDRARIRATLNRIGKHALVLHPDAELRTLAILPEEQAILDAITTENPTLPQLLARGIADEEIVSSLVYALAVTRQFAFKGQKKGPMAARGASPWRAAAPSSSSPRTQAPSASRPRPSTRVPSRPPPGVRRIAPAVRPAGVAVRANAPQIRPIGSKRATVQGLAPSSPAPARARIDTPPDAMKTTVMASPSLRSAPPRAPVSADATDEIAVDPGAELADAEAALEAMTSFRLAEAALQRNDVVAAEALAEKAVRADPSQADYVSLLAWVRALSGTPASTDAAIATMSRVLVEDPSNERARLYRGRLFVRTNRFGEALADFDELLAVNPHHREAASEVRALRQRMG